MLFSNRGDGRPRRRSPAVQKGYRPCRGRRRARPRNHGAAGMADAAVMPRFFRTDGAVAPPITAIAGIPGGGHMTLRTGASLPRIAPEGKRTASGLTRNQMPGNGLRVRIPCPPLFGPAVSAGFLAVPGPRLIGAGVRGGGVCVPSNAIPSRLGLYVFLCVEGPGAAGSILKEESSPTGSCRTPPDSNPLNPILDNRPRPT